MGQANNNTLAVFIKKIKYFSPRLEITHFFGGISILVVSTV
jgi:hypothetical protein